MIAEVKPKRAQAPATPRRHALAPPLMKFTITNFKDGRSITYTLFTGGFYRFQLAGEKPVQTDVKTYPQAAAIARRKYNLPAIGCASYAKEIAA